MNYVVTVTSQGQISIPAQVRRQLNLDQIKTAILSVNKNTIEISPTSDILKLRGVFASPKLIPFKKTRADFESSLAQGKA